MALRTFRDGRGRVWQVWTVFPAFAERRQGMPTSAHLEVDRRRRNEPRVRIGSKWANGWLAVETPGDKRRLAEYPQNWETLSDEALEALCKSATKVPPSRRLVE